MSLALGYRCYAYISMSISTFRTQQLDTKMIVFLMSLALRYRCYAYISMSIPTFRTQQLTQYMRNIRILERNSLEICA